MKKMFSLNKIAAIMAFIIGMMAVFAGGKVLLGILPDYYVIDWLPIYNFVVGLSSAFFTSIIIWKNNRLALPAAITTFGLHAIVMVILQAGYHNLVAPDSIIAMTVRLVIWMTILALMTIQQRKKQVDNGK